LLTRIDKSKCFRCEINTKNITLQSECLEIHTYYASIHVPGCKPGPNQITFYCRLYAASIALQCYINSVRGNKPVFKSAVFRWFFNGSLVKETEKAGIWKRNLSPSHIGSYHCQLVSDYGIIKSTNAVSLLPNHDICSDEYSCKYFRNTHCSGDRGDRILSMCPTLCQICPVYEIPWIAAWNRDLPARFGHAFSLRCMFGQQPQYNYTWFKDGKVIKFEHKSVIHFNISKQHISRYKCKAPLNDHASNSVALSCSMDTMVGNASLQNDTYHVYGCPSSGVTVSAVIMIYILCWLYESAFIL